jgi:hypothetical protein
MSRELKLELGLINPPTFTFIMDIANRKNHGLQLTDIQDRHVAMIQSLIDLSNHGLSALPKDHCWYFLFELIGKFAHGLDENTRGYNLMEYNDNLRFLVMIYNCCISGQPWKPQGRFLDFWLTSGGWEERIRRLMYEQPLEEGEARQTLSAILYQIEQIIAFVNNLKLA